MLASARVKDINPLCNVDVYNLFINEKSLEQVLSKDIDVVVDAIDGLNSKINLIVKARRSGIDVVSSMGAVGRMDISMIRTGDISETSVCPLARVVRQRLHRRGIYKGVRAVYSIEKPLNKQVDDIIETPIQQEHGRPRSLIGTVAWVPGVFGLSIASQVIKLIIDRQQF